MMPSKIKSASKNCFLVKIANCRQQEQYLRNMFWIVVLTLAAVALYIALMQYYAWGWVLTPLFEPKQDYKPSTKVTVLVPARNEAAHIQKLSQCLLAQNYPTELLQIILINDHSEDDTAVLASKAGLNVLSLPAHLQGKKAAITYGVSQASGELIITTDADCAMDSDWVATIVQFYETNRYKVITGPVVFSKPNNQSTNQPLYYFQSLDLMGLMYITAGSLRFKFPHMANGANFAFEKKLFESIGGYSGIDGTPTGDDILFLLKADGHHPGCAGFIKAKEAIITTKATPTWPAFWQQRLRWVSKSAGFGDARLTAILVFYYLYALAIVACGAGMVFEPLLSLPFILLLLGKWVSEGIMMAHAATFFGRLSHLWWFVPSQIIHLYYVLRIGLQSQLSSYQWKGRGYRSKQKLYK